VSWHGGCRVCGTRVIDGWCDHGASATHDVREADVRAAALELWEQIHGGASGLQDSPRLG
jgi:hypothetical protein